MRFCPLTKEYCCPHCVFIQEDTATPEKIDDCALMCFFNNVPKILNLMLYVTQIKKGAENASE